MVDDAWRGDTYAHLRAARTNEQWPLYAEFAGLQERGLRKQALAKAKLFADEMSPQPLSQRWAFVSWLCTDVLAERVVTQLSLIHISEPTRPY